MSVKALPCPFCGKAPSLYPKDPKREGDAWGEVRCDNGHCAAQPAVSDGTKISDERGTDAYQRAAIKRWNKRS